MKRQKDEMTKRRKDRKTKIQKDRKPERQEVEKTEIKKDGKMKRQKGEKTASLISMAKYSTLRSVVSSRQCCFVYSCYKWYNI